MILVDSDVLICHLRGVEVARRWLRRARETTGPLAISVLSVTEVTGGMRSTERREVWELLGTLRKHPVDEAVARRAGELQRRYRRSHGAIGLVDYVVAATAQLGGLELATLNVKHFPMFPKLEPPFQLTAPT